MPIIKQVNIDNTIYDILTDASVTETGKVNTDAQSFAGDKTFTGSLIANSTFVGAVGSKDTGNITTTVPIGVGDNNQIMFMLDDNAVHSVSVTQAQTSGSAVGTITIDGTSTVLYSPSSKPIQTAVNSPSASGTTTQFISTISQNSNGVITATKANMPAPYVTAQGSSNSWYYRKWSDLTYECWRSITATVNITTAWGNLYYAKINAISYPVTFTSNPYELATLHSSSDWYCMLSHGESYNTTSATCAYAAVRPSSTSSVPIVLHYYARGKVSS